MPTKTKIGRFAVFAGDRFNSRSNGWDTYQGSNNDEMLAGAIVGATMRTNQTFNWWQLVDLNNNKVIKQWRS